MESWSRRFNSARIRCLPLLSVPPAPAAAETTTTVSSSADDAVSDAISECQLPLIQRKKHPHFAPLLVLLNNTTQIWKQTLGNNNNNNNPFIYREKRELFSLIIILLLKKALSLSTCAPRTHRNRNYIGHQKASLFFLSSLLLSLSYL